MDDIGFCFCGTEATKVDASAETESTNYKSNCIDED
jgi:hypothetical protein